jgi:hypothetical protein
MPTSFKTTTLSVFCVFWYQFSSQNDLEGTFVWKFGIEEHNCILRILKFGLLWLPRVFYVKWGNSKFCSANFLNNSNSNCVIFWTLSKKITATTKKTRKFAKFSKNLLNFRVNAWNFFGRTSFTNLFSSFQSNKFRFNSIVCKI